MATASIGKNFILAGEAIFTVSNGEEHYTYQVVRVEANDRFPEKYLMHLLTGPNNTSDYTYFGVLEQDGTIRRTSNSKLRDNAKPFQVARWAIAAIWDGRTFPDNYSIQHVGKCGRCGSRLTRPESITSGLGPVCAQKGSYGNGISRSERPATDGSGGELPKVEGTANVGKEQADLRSSDVKPGQVDSVRDAASQRAGSLLQNSGHEAAAA